MQRVPAGVPSGKNSVRTLVREPARRQDITAEQGPISLPLRRHQIRCDRNPYLERAPEDHLHCVRGLLPPLGVTRPLDPPMTTVFLKSQEPRSSGVIEDLFAPVSIRPGCLAEPSGSSLLCSVSRSGT